MDDGLFQCDARIVLVRMFATWLVGPTIRLSPLLRRLRDGGGTAARHHRQKGLLTLSLLFLFPTLVFSPFHYDYGRK